DAAPPPPASTTATGTDPLGGARTAQPPGTVALTDLRPVRDDPDGNLWTSGEEHLAGVPRGRALAATGAWCGTTRLEFALDGEYARFSALTGISDRSAETRPLRFYVLTDGHRAVDLPEVGRAPQPVDVPVAGVTRLVIGVQPPAGDTSTCPGPERVGVFADPLLTRAG
ncbi:NPCBM/NEW2 domain-containing protein, partial [Saccharothrix algeriensis]